MLGLSNGIRENVSGAFIFARKLCDIGIGMHTIINIRLVDCRGKTTVLAKALRLVLRHLPRLNFIYRKQNTCIKNLRLLIKKRISLCNDIFSKKMKELCLQQQWQKDSRKLQYALVAKIAEKLHPYW